MRSPTVSKVTLLLTLGSLALTGCECGGGDTTDRDAGSRVDSGPTADGGPSMWGPVRMSVPIAEWVSDINLTAGVPRRDVFVTNVPTEFGTIAEVTVDLEGTLPHLTATRLDGGDTPETFQISLAIGPGDQMATVCDSAPRQGPATVMADGALNPLSVEPTSMDAADETLSALNSGQVSVCLETTSTVDAIVSIDEILLEVILRNDCDLPPENLAGDWSGTYECTSACESGEMADIELTVAQSGITAVYWDEEAYYVGTVCGNEFRFRGGTAFYSEWGVLTLTGPDSAEKRSTYISTGTGCMGDCVDILTR